MKAGNIMASALNVDPISVTQASIEKSAKKESPERKELAEAVLKGLKLVPVAAIAPMDGAEALQQADVTDIIFKSIPTLSDETIKSVLERTGDIKLIVDDLINSFGKARIEDALTALRTGIYKHKPAKETKKEIVDALKVSDKAQIKRVKADIKSVLTHIVSVLTTVLDTEGLVGNIAENMFSSAAKKKLSNPEASPLSSTQAKEIAKTMVTHTMAARLLANKAAGDDRPVIEQMSEIQFQVHERKSPYRVISINQATTLGLFFSGEPSDRDKAAIKLNPTVLAQPVTDEDRTQLNQFKTHTQCQTVEEYVTKFEGTFVGVLVEGDKIFMNCNLSYLNILGVEMDPSQPMTLNKDIQDHLTRLETGDLTADTLKHFFGSVLPELNRSKMCLSQVDADTPWLEIAKTIKSEIPLEHRRLLPKASLKIDADGRVAVDIVLDDGKLDGMQGIDDTGPTNRKPNAHSEVSEVGTYNLKEFKLNTKLLAILEGIHTPIVEMDQ